MVISSLERLRKVRGFSQAFLAKKIHISRPTFIQIEKGRRELSLSQAETIAQIFDVRLEDLVKGAPVFIEPNVVLQKQKALHKHMPEIRISVPQKNLEKFREVLLYILEKVGAKPNIGETALYKLLYFIDFDFYEKYDRQLIGATYIRNHYGPTPIEFKKIVENMEARGEVEKVQSKYFQYEQKKYLPRRSPDLSKLSALELTHIDDVLSRLSDKTATELSDYSHTDVPWQVHQPGEIMSYESVFYRDPKHSVRNYEDEL